MRTFFLLTLIAFLFSACPTIPSQPSGYNLGESIMIGMDEYVSIPSAGIRLRLTDVKDSRCPKGTDCIRAGEAKVMLEVIENDVPKEITLEGKGMCYKESGSCGDSASAYGKNVELLYVYPYPTEENRKDKNYAIKVIVR